MLFAGAAERPRARPAQQNPKMTSLRRFAAEPQGRRAGSWPAAACQTCRNLPRVSPITTSRTSSVTLALPNQRRIVGAPRPQPSSDTENLLRPQGPLGTLRDVGTFTRRAG